MVIKIFMFILAILIVNIVYFNLKYLVIIIFQKKNNI
jgi:hypothetical protein